MYIDMGYLWRYYPSGGGILAYIRWNYPDIDLLLQSIWLIGNCYHSEISPKWVLS